MTRMGRYQIQGELGRGAMGIVYRALDPSIGRTVAIKTIRLSELSDAGERDRLHDRLFREAQSAGMLSHPNIVTVYDIGQEGDTAYIAMELVEGPTLEHRMRSGALDAQQVISILQQTAAALDYAHKRGVIHRDIKPANIMLHEGTMVKITDFGIAKVQSAQATQTTTITGTPNYMSPEQIQGQPVDGRSDQFSLGVIAFELLTGERPFPGESMPTILFKIVREAPPAPQNLNPSLGWAIETVLARALAKSPDDRYKSCADFIRALESACNSSKGWKPLAPGTVQSLPTVREAAGTDVTDKDVGRSVAEAAAAAERVPKPLRIARLLAIVIVAGGIVSALMIYGLQYFGLQEEPAAQPQAAQQKTAQAPETSSPRPSPTAVAQLPAPKEPDPIPLSEQKAEEQQEQKKQAPTPRQEVKVDSSQPHAALLVTTPPGASVIVDSNQELSCKTPCSLNLSGGRHTLSASLAGYRRALRIFELPREPEVVVNLDRTTGTVFIRSDPGGASITINGEGKAEKTPTTLTLPTGAYKIEVSKAGYQTYVENIEVKDAVMTNIDVNWPAKAH